jgi:hypothetical protein
MFDASRTYDDGQLIDLDVSAGSGPARRYCADNRSTPLCVFVLATGFTHRGTAWDHDRQMPLTSAFAQRRTG